VPPKAITEEHFDRLFNINVKGALFTVQKALLNDGGSIILTGSVASAKGTPGFWVYGATKAAIRNFVRAWTIELKDAASAQTSSARVRPKRRWGIISLPRLLRGLYPASRWDAQALPRRLPRPRYSLPRMIPVSSRASNYSSMAAGHKSDRRHGRQFVRGAQTHRDCRWNVELTPTRLVMLSRNLPHDWQERRRPSDLRLPDAAPIQHDARHVTASRAVSTIEVSQKLKEPHHYEVARRALLTDGYQELEG
jgi:NAD(P)-dependent dehydrogenase (short-subunit alcohol dehydrogenase family)